MSTPQENVELYIESIDQALIGQYREYWATIKPKTPAEVYERWLFAFLSVHTTWQRNVSSFQLLQGKKVSASKSELFDTIVSAGVGLHHMRTDGIWKFHYDFWANPESWMFDGQERWSDYRDRMMARCHGLKEAKTSFALELCYPDECGVVCLDTHMLQLYGCTKKGTAVSPNKYREMEQHWLACCQKRQLPSPLVRHVYWDKVQKQPDTKYWTHVFEQPQLEHTRLTVQHD